MKMKEKENFIRRTIFKREEYSKEGMMLYIYIYTIHIHVYCKCIDVYVSSGRFKMQQKTDNSRGP